MSAVKRWKVTHSIKYPGRWRAYQTYGGYVVPGSSITFRTWHSAMGYVQSRIRWSRR